jgi:hypothetical protein
MGRVLALLGVLYQNYKKMDKYLSNNAIYAHRHAFCGFIQMFLTHY